MPLHVGFRGSRVAEDTAVGVDEGRNARPCLSVSDGSRGRSPEQLIRTATIRLGLAITEESPDETLRYHVELSEIQDGVELTALVGNGKHYAHKIKRAQITARDRQQTQRRRYRHCCGYRRLDRLQDQAPLR